MAERAKVRDALLEHIPVHGMANWAPLEAQFPDMPEHRFWGHISATMKAGLPADLVKSGISRAKAVKIAGDNIPQAPAPEYMTRAGAKAERNIDFLRALADLHADAMLLRAFAMKVDEKTGEESIKNPMVFDNSINRRLAIVERATKVMGEVWDLQRMREFYDMILEEIGQESPAALSRIVARLKDINTRYGFTVYAGPE